MKDINYLKALLRMRLWNLIILLLGDLLVTLSYKNINDKWYDISITSNNWFLIFYFSYSKIIKQYMNYVGNYTMWHHYSFSKKVLLVFNEILKPKLPIHLYHKIIEVKL